MSDRDKLDSLLADHATAARHRDAPTGEDDRYAIYTIRDGERARLAETSEQGIGMTLVTLTSEGEFANQFGQRTPVGIFDRQSRTWIVNPWVKA